MQVAEGIERMTQGTANFYLIHDRDSAVLVDAGTPSHTGFAERAHVEGEVEVWLHEDDRDRARGTKHPKNDGNIFPHLLRSQALRTTWTLVRKPEMHSRQRIR